MKLSFQQIKSATLGAMKVHQEDGLVCFERFTDEQRALYKATAEGFYLKALAAAGIKLCFRTDSSRLRMTVHISDPTSRDYFSANVYADGALIGQLDNFEERQLGVFSKEFSLPQGEKTVTVYLPWSMRARLEALELDDGASFAPVKPGKKLLMYGDSITQGYDAVDQSKRYGAVLADFLDAEEHNLGIGGEKFFPLLAQTEIPFKPDFVTVAYGTNDWSSRTEEEFTPSCRAFLQTVLRNNPQAEIFVITPIWRKDYQEEKNGWLFHNVEQTIRSVCREYPRVKVLRGFDFVPKNEAYYYDQRLHPNDEGFAHYAENLCRAIADARK